MFAQARSSNFNDQDAIHDRLDERTIVAFHATK
jgi:hypothetical protein